MSQNQSPKNKALEIRVSYYQRLALGGPCLAMRYLAEPWLSQAIYEITLRSFDVNRALRIKRNTMTEITSMLRNAACGCSQHEVSRDPGSLLVMREKRERPFWCLDQTPKSRRLRESNDLVCVCSVRPSSVGFADGGASKRRVFFDSERGTHQRAT